MSFNKGLWLDESKCADLDRGRETSKDSVSESFSAITQDPPGESLAKGEGKPKGETPDATTGCNTNKTRE